MSRALDCSWGHLALKTETKFAIVVGVRLSGEGPKPVNGACLHRRPIFLFGREVSDPFWTGSARNRLRQAARPACLQAGGGSSGQCTWKLMSATGATERRQWWPHFHWRLLGTQKRPRRLLGRLDTDNNNSHTAAIVCRQGAIWPQGGIKDQNGKPQEGKSVNHELHALPNGI